MIKMNAMKLLLKNAREEKGFKTREVARLLAIDQALISKFESGQRQPTKKQIVQLSQLLEIDFDTLMIAWLKEKILHAITDETLGLQALQAVEKELNPKTADAIDILFDEMDALKNKMEAFRRTQTS